LRSLLRNFRGTVVFAAFTANTIFWFVPLFLLAIIKLILPVAPIRRRLTRMLTWIGEQWIDVNGVIVRLACAKRIATHGLDGLRPDGWYLVMSNHQTWVDILVLQSVFNRRIPFLKFFIKQQLIWFPFLGLAWWALDMPFMKRHSASYLAKHPHMRGKDLETTRKACQKFRDIPTSVINFLEGTRVTEEKCRKRNSPYQRLLPPRAGGFAVAMSSMGELFDSILDVTLVYRGSVPQFWAMCCGHDVDVIVDVRQRVVEQWLASGDYENDREFRRKVHRWLGDVWQEKDELIQRIEAEERL
jgi:1-acyl-sn-glycerol-3-phosphate acyltransferase